MILIQIISKILRRLRIKRILIIFALTKGSHNSYGDGGRKRRPSKKSILTIFSAGLLVWILFLASSCSTSRHVQTQLVEKVSKDTIYLRNVQYDSIYINLTSDTDRTRDTITITKTMTEYRYKYLRDTVRIVQRDSIPYEVRIVETKEIRKPLNLFDYICYISFGILTSILALKVFRMTKAL